MDTGGMWVDSRTCLEIFESTPKIEKQPANRKGPPNGTNGPPNKRVHKVRALREGSGR